MIPAETMQTFRFALANDERGVAERIIEDYSTCDCHRCRSELSILKQMLDEHFAQPAELELATSSPSPDDVQEALDRR